MLYSECDRSWIGVGSEYEVCKKSENMRVSVYGGCTNLSAETSSAILVSVLTLILHCFSHHSACHIKNARIRRISSCRSSTSSSQRSTRARERHHSICRAMTSYQYLSKQTYARKYPHQLLLPHLQHH